MVGITRFGTYVPLFRLGKGTEAWKGRGERAVAGFDEDSVTMGVAAALNCTSGMDLSIVDALYFASTTSPFREKQAATLVAKTVDLKDSITTADFGGSLRAGTTAIKAAVDAVKAGTARNVLVVAADERQPQPRSEFDENIGDGAAAFIVGREGVVGEIEDICSYSHEIYDIWRSDADVFPRSAEDRFVLEEGYQKSLREIGAAVLGRNKLAPRDFARLAVYAPNARRLGEACRVLGFDEKTQLAASYFGQMGETGCAFALMVLVGELEKASAGERILTVSYGQGADAIIVKTKEGVGKAKAPRTLDTYLSSKKLVPSYLNYLRWRGLLDMAHGAKRPPPKVPGVHAMYREIPQNLGLYGGRCRKCGTVQYPAERVCTNCTAKDSMDPYKLSRKATLFTYSIDYLGPVLEPPMVGGILDFEGGGRGLFNITDRDPSQLKIGMPLEMSFRRLHTVEGIHNYYWCATPPRA